MDKEEIMFAYLEGFLLKVADQVGEMSLGTYSVTFTLEKVLVGGKNA